MKKSNQLTTGAYFFYASLSLLLPACRSTPAPPLPESPPDAQQPAPPDVPPEITIPPGAAPAPAPKSQREIIARHLPESRLGMPEKDLAARRVEYNTMLNSRPREPTRNTAWQYRMTRQGQIVGFEFSNRGGNRILPPLHDASKNQFFTRDFQFRFDERARQDIHLLVSDWVASPDRTFRLSEIMNSMLLFFPRAFLPAIVNAKNRNIVTLPTGEEVEFDPVTHEIVNGVLSESPVDLNPDRVPRKFPAVDYHGKGVMIRANARGTDPRIGTTALITAGTPPQNCGVGSDCGRCEVAAKDLWDQTGAARFKFATDRELDRFLDARCGFGLPRIGSDFAVAVPAR
ncbi:MAG: hypothetical protein ACREQ2_29150 [Candidatus Binatia bacterium]